MYLTLQFNGETFKKRPKDLREAILSVKPDVLHTEMYVTLKRGEDVREKRLNLREGRRLFNNSDFMDVFLMNLTLK